MLENVCCVYHPARKGMLDAAMEACLFDQLGLRLLQVRRQSHIIIMLYPFHGRMPNLQKLRRASNTTRSSKIQRTASSGSTSTGI